MPDNKPKWTPGPWAYKPISGYQYVVELKPRLAGMAQGMMLVASIPAGHSEEEVRANLTLAAAAPCLYDALELYVEHFGDPLKVARAALAKARGKQTDAQ